MSVALTNCGQAGWVTDRSGYRYDPIDPATGRPWPAMPAAFANLVVEAADAAGFDGFCPDACLVNRYAPGARLSLHHDRNERDFDRPSCPYRWACRPSSCGAAKNAPTGFGAFRWCMAMS
jgi:alkylated DNA repair protein (DNA oxidative demethylase)